MEAQKLIFVSGTGRSGTHLVGRTLASHPQIEGRIEENNTFKLITRIATTQDYRPSWLTELSKKRLLRRMSRILKASPHHILEKSHPSLWLVEELMTLFDQSYFVGVWRDPEPTINSMLKHQGVLSWYRKLPQNKPNRFLGITRENADHFDQLSLAQKCYFRWHSHKQELLRLKSLFPERVSLVKYDAFVQEPEYHLNDLARFLGLEALFEVEPIKINGLDSWKRELSDDTLSQIATIAASVNT